MLTGIHHTSITVSDMERSITFYRDMLGFELIWDSQALGLKFEGPMADAVTQCLGTSQRLAFMELNGRRIEFVEYTPTGAVPDEIRMSDTGAMHIAFRCTDVDALYKKLVDNGVRVHCEPQQVFDMRLFYFRDPDGVGLEAMEGKLREVPQ
jgi:catechol 2,3-dioxygenase-like lactoylglutathione lyase family enzyme